MTKNIIKMNSLKDIITRCDLRKDKIAFLEKNKETNKFEPITYFKLKEDVLNFGTAITKVLKIADSKIAVIGENSYKWFVTYMSTICGPNVIVPLDKELPSNEIASLLKRADVKCVVYSKRKSEVIDAVKEELVGKDIIYVSMEEIENEKYDMDSLINEGKSMRKSGNDFFEKYEADANSFSVLLFTSGTTMKSKGVMLSQSNLANNVYSIMCGYSDAAERTFLSVLPIHHTFEFTISYLCPLSEGGTVGICEGLKYVSKNLKEIKPECMCVVPALLEIVSKKINKGIEEQHKEGAVKFVKGLTEFIGFNKENIRKSVFKKIHENIGGRLKYIFCGGAPIDKKIIEDMEGLGFIVLQGYGLTETSPLIAGTPIAARKAGTVGKAIKNVEIRIDLSSDSSNVGEIMVKGPNVMLGYYQDEEETGKALKKGWFYTGDVGFFDNTGNLVITGRSKNVIVTSNGKNIFPEELEVLINKVPLVSESMVYGEGNNNDLTVAVKVTLDEAYIEEKYASLRPTDEEIYNIIWNEIKEINRKVETYKAIKKLEIKKDNFVKTTTLKIKRNEEIKK